ncbi:MAG: ABC-F family ATP-binding cassette domain-containing protein [Candidatus Aminicenantes bacterium]|nr:ABC-F family ATP-binding cassette domain-containing protein [Candidatus Aminicenantes bacterium]
MIRLQDVELAYNDKKLFSAITWLIPDGSRIGLVGENGAGKTTLFRTILGDVALDGGAIEIASKERIGYLPQDLVELEPLPVMAYLRRKTGQEQLERNIHGCQEAMAFRDPHDPGFAAALKKLDAASEAFLMQDGYGFESRARRILKGLGFTPGDEEKNCRHFSGGWKMRIFLAVILLSGPEIMLLDEPTNHLDTESMEWLEGFLRDYRGTLLAISHDHMFLDKMVQQVAELHRGALTLTKGNYTRYLREKERHALALQKKRELQKAEIKRLQSYIDRFRAKASKASEVQSRIKQLEKFELLPAPLAAKRVRFRFPEGRRSGREVITADNLEKAYGGRTIFRDVSFTVCRGEKVALLGINGAGKSTLARLLARMEPPGSGAVHWGFQVKAGFFSQESEQNVSYGRTVWEEARAVEGGASDQEVRDLLGAFLFSGDDVLKPVSVLSGGEKSRLALVKILLQDSNCLILDEPTNHLDLRTREIFQEALRHYPGTIILVSHDRHFLDSLVNRVFELRAGRLYEYAGNYSHFVRKREAEIAAEEPGQGEPSASGPDAPTQKKTGKTREQRRLEAEERNRRGRARRELAEQVQELEGEIGRLEEVKCRDQKFLCDPAVLADSLRVQELMKELSEAEAKLKKLLPEWEQLMAELEKLETK